MTDVRASKPSSIQRAIQHLVVCANPSQVSFDHAIVEAYSREVADQGQNVKVRDLYALGFDPVLKDDERPTHPNWKASTDVGVELDFLSKSSILVLVYPIWFGFPPAILKGYVDRVLGAGYSLDDLHDQVGQIALRDKPLLSFSTSGASESWLREQGQTKALREIFDVYLWRGFGMKQSEHIQIDSVVPDIDKAYASEHLNRVRSAAKRTCDALASDHSAMSQMR